MLFGFYVGAVKELADAFRDLDGSGYLDWLLKEDASLPGLAADISNARAAVDRKDPDSLYSKLLKRVRDTAGFHVQRGDVQGALEALGAEQFRGAEVTGPEQRIVEVPVVSTILAFLIMGEDRQALPALVKQIQELQRSLQNVAHDLYLILVRFATELGNEAV